MPNNNNNASEQYARPIRAEEEGEREKEREREREVMTDSMTNAHFLAPTQGRWMQLQERRVERGGMLTGGHFCSPLTIRVAKSACQFF